MSKGGDAVALVLRRFDSGESDRRIIVLTDEFGKIDLYAKGARKGGSRLASSTEPLVVARFQWAEGRARRFITSVEPRSSFPRLREDFDRLSCALAWVEVLALSLSEEIVGTDSYNLGLATVEWIDKRDNPVASLCFGLSVLLSLEGHQPDWLQCVETGESLSSATIFVSAHAGGYVSIPTAYSYNDRLEVSAEALVALQRLPDLAEPPPAIKNVEEVLRVLFSFWGAITDRPLPACQAVYESTRATLW